MAREVQRSMLPIPDPPSSDYPGDTSKFNGKIDLVQINLGDHNHDHLINPTNPSASPWPGSKPVMARQ